MKSRKPQSFWTCTSTPSADGLTPAFPSSPKRPFLILGKDLREFLQARHPRKQPCRAGEIYCLRCRTPKRPAFDEVEFVPKTATIGVLAGLCPTCASMLYRLTKTASLAAATGDLKVTRSPAQERLCDSPDPSLNVHFQ